MNQDCISYHDRYKRSMNAAEAARDPSCRFSWRVDADKWLKRHFDAVEVQAAEKWPDSWIASNPLDHSARGKLAKGKAKF